MLKIKNKVFGEGKPLVCVPVMDARKEDIIAEVKRLAENNAEIIEWRVDAFEGAKSLNAVREVLTEIAPFIKASVLVFTFRSKEQGGMSSLDGESIYDLHQVAAESKVVDFIDMEYFYTENADAEIRALHKMGAKVITSHHDFHETPPAGVLFMLLEQMKQSNADIVKLAVMPQSSDDVLSLLSETNHFHKRYPKQPMITMSMGKLGAISRICGETFGSCVTFGVGKNASAPGQIEMTKLEEILQVLRIS